MPFLPQPSHFILAWDRHQICWLAYRVAWLSVTWKHHTTTVLWPFFQYHPAEPVPEENFWTLWCKGRLTEADTLTIWLSATPSELNITRLHHAPHFLQAGCPSCRPANSVKALKARVSRGKQPLKWRRKGRRKSWTVVDWKVLLCVCVVC